MFRYFHRIVSLVCFSLRTTIVSSPICSNECQIAKYWTLNRNKEVQTPFVNCYRLFWVHLKDISVMQFQVCFASLLPAFVVILLLRFLVKQQLQKVSERLQSLSLSNYFSLTKTSVF